MASLFKIMIQMFIIKLKWAASSSPKQTQRLGFCCHANTGKSKLEAWLANRLLWKGRLFLLFGVMWRGVCYKLPVTFGFATPPTKQPTCNYRDFVAHFSQSVCVKSFFFFLNEHPFWHLNDRTGAGVHYLFCLIKSESTI